MIIYRIENENKEGPYQATSSKFWNNLLGNSYNKHHCIKNRPMPQNDPKMGLAIYPYRYKSAFVTLKHLRKWFNGTDLIKLRKYGFNVVKINLSKNDIIYGKKQCLFIDPRK